jgi:hypothetical protein
LIAGRRVGAKRNYIFPQPPHSRSADLLNDRSISDPSFTGALEAAP